MRIFSQIQIFISVVSAIIVCLLAGCGYTTRAGIRSDLKTIFVTTFKNETFEHGLDIALTDAVINEFIFDGNLEVVPNSYADVKLSGTITGYDLQPITYREADIEVAQYRIRIAVSLVFTDLHSDIVLWRAQRVEGDATFLVSGSLARTEQEALELALVDLAKKIVARTVESW